MIYIHFVSSQELSSTWRRPSVHDWHETHKAALAHLLSSPVQSCLGLVINYDQTQPNQVQKRWADQVIFEVESFWLRAHLYHSAILTTEGPQISLALKIQVDAITIIILETLNGRGRQAASSGNELMSLSDLF